VFHVNYFIPRKHKESLNINRLNYKPYSIRINSEFDMGSHCVSINYSVNGLSWKNNE